MAAQAAAKRVALGLGAVAKPGAEVAQRSKAVEFFREVTRCVPWTIQNYHIAELVTVGELRKNIAALFRQNAGVQTPEVIDLLIYKGRGELESVIMQHKQRHHLITKYVREPALLRDAQNAAKSKATGHSSFLDKFYESNA